MAAKRFDTIILGGGPAGLSAAVYMGRYLRSTLVIDAERGRAAGHQVNENYLGFPKGIKVQRLRELGRQQAERFGVTFHISTATCIYKTETGFEVECADGKHFAATQLIAAMGVSDIWPSFPHVERYVGKSLFWCITCDGYKIQGHEVLLLGNDDDAATTALQFLRFTKRLCLLAHPDHATISAKRRQELKRAGIELIEGAIAGVKGAKGQIKAVTLEDGTTLNPEYIFSLYGAVPNSQLLASLGVMLDDHGFIAVDENQQTNVENLFAAGDITGVHAHQIACAVHEGATAASAANYALYPPIQRHDEPAEREEITT